MLTIQLKNATLSRVLATAISVSQPRRIYRTTAKMISRTMRPNNAAIAHGQSSGVQDRDAFIKDSNKSHRLVPEDGSNEQAEENQRTNHVRQSGPCFFRLWELINIPADPEVSTCSLHDGKCQSDPEAHVQNGGNCRQHRFGNDLPNVFTGQNLSECCHYQHDWRNNEQYTFEQARPRDVVLWADQLQ